VCCRQPRRLYASRYCELKRFVGSSGGCSRAAEGRFLKQFEISTDATDAPNFKRDDENRKVKHSGDENRKVKHSREKTER